MPAPKRVTPQRLSLAAFAVVLAAGSASIWLTHRAEESDLAAQSEQLGVDLTPTTVHDHSSHEHGAAVDPADGEGVETPDGLGSDTGHGDVPIPTLPPGDPVSAQPDTPATTVPEEDPNNPGLPRTVDPGVAPVAAPPESELFMAVKQAENQSMWVYDSVLEVEDLVAHYMGALNSGEWIVTDSRTLATSADPDAPVEFYEIFASAPGKSATVRIHTNDYGQAQAQLEITYE